MDRCPNCRARVTDSANCRRCGMSLEELLWVEAAANRYLSHALKDLLNDEPNAAMANLRQARLLKDDPFVVHLLKFASDLIDSPGAGS